MSDTLHPVEDALVRFGRTAAEGGLGVHGAHLLLGDGGSAERNWSSDVRRDVFSVSKTFTSVAVGIAQGEGLLDLDDPILTHLPHLAGRAAIGVEWITVRHLLQMSSGIGFRWEDDPPGDPAEAVVAEPLGFGPGHGFAYRGGSSYLLSRIVAACSGTDLRDFLQPRLFAPLEIAEPVWQRCPRGFSLGAVGLELRTAEIARLGQTLLDGGRYADREVVPADYVSAMTADTVPVGDHRATHATGPPAAGTRYGLHIWVDTQLDAWRMDGILGQFCVGIPRLGACVTVTSHYRGPTSDILDAIWADLVPGLG